MPGGLKVLITLLTQLPLAGGLWLGWGRVRPAVALAAGAVYEVLVFAVAFGRKVWTDELEKDAVKVTADWVRAFVRGFAPGFRRRYKKQVVQDHGVFNVRGLGLINTYTLSLDQVFVDLRINPPDPRKFNLDPVARKELEGNRPIWDFLRTSRPGAQIATALAVIGPPGCGKTTLLQHVAVTLALNRQRRHKVRAYTPVLLFLRDHVRKILREQPPPLGRLVEDYFGAPALFPTLRPRPEWFEKEIESGRCMILLDGLDEVADADERRAVSAWVDKQIASYPRCPFLLTARPQGYADAPLQRANVLEVQPFNARQVRRFVENWYLANEIVASGNREDEGVRGRARKDAEDLLRRLRATPSLDALTVNPLLLTMIAMVHRYHGALPGSRVELYGEICEVLLGRWRQSRGVHDPLKTGQKLVVLRPLAAHMMESKVRDIMTRDAASVIAEPLKLVGVTDGAAPEKFLSDLQSGSGLLLEREAGQWSFAHLTFQEYLTAAHWLEQKETDRDWRTLVADSWWHETLRLYAAQGDATPLVRACLDDDTVTALALAADFLEEARQLLPEVRQAAEQRLIEDLESDDPARRRLAAEVKLTRRLRNLQRIDDRREIDLDFITCAEYQLFLDDMRAQGDHRQPDHWTEVEFARGDALKPVAGVWAEDAVAFCDWLTQRQGGGVRYRLPQPDEARQHLAHTAALAAWCGNQGSFSLTGLSAADEQAIRRQLVGLSTLPLPSGLAIARTHIPYLDLSVDLASGVALDLDLALAVDLAIVLARQLGITYNYNLLSARSYAGDLDLDLAFIRGRTLDFDPYFYTKRERHRVLARARSCAGDCARRLYLVRAHDLNLSDDSYHAFALALALAHAHAHLLVFLLDSYEAPFSDELTDSQQSEQRWMTAPNISVKQWVTFLNELITLARAPTMQARLLVQRKYAARILGCVYISSKLAEQRKARFSLWRRTPYSKEIRSETGTFQKDVLGLHWWFQIVSAREEGKLTPWEGIRIVREQASGRDTDERRR